MILIEGLDNTGKDTIIENLRRHELFRESPTLHIHNGAPPRGDATTVSATMYELFQETYLSASDLPATCFINRGHISGAVYDQLYRPEAHNMRGFYKADHALNPDRDVILYLTGHPLAIAERDDGLSTYTDKTFNEMIRKINAEDTLFRHALTCSSIPSAIIDTTGTQEESLQQALHFLSTNLEVLVY